MLDFKPITIDIVGELLLFTNPAVTRSCDYTPGNLVMWARFMDYRYAIHNGTLFVKCKSQADMSTPAFLPPLGKMPLTESIGVLQQHCNHTGEPLHFTAVPQEFIAQLQELLPSHTSSTLESWSDYIYSAQSLATLQGKALNKKRNRYNKFIAEQPGYSYSRFTVEDTKEVVAFIAQHRECQHNRSDNMRCYEQWQCLATVRNIIHYSQPAAVLRVDGKIAAFTLGEVFGDTLFVHIEKASRDIAGAAEAINRMFVNDMLEQYPQIEYVNREEDLGDPGLRQVKRAYNPLFLLERYELVPKQS